MSRPEHTVHWDVGETKGPDGRFVVVVRVTCGTSSIQALMSRSEALSIAGLIERVANPRADDKRLH